MKNKNSELDSEIAELKNHSCPSGWITGGKLGCYFVASNRPTMSRDYAKKFCQSLDKRAHLLEIRNHDIQAFIGKLDLSSAIHWWIGATDLQKVFDSFVRNCKLNVLRSKVPEIIFDHCYFQEGHWVWENSGISATFLNWYPGQPQGGKSENCAVIDTPRHDMWHDAPCTYSYKTICQILI